jgi:hypothetical protein
MGSQNLHNVARWGINYKTRFKDVQDKVTQTSLNKAVTTKTYDAKQQSIHNTWALAAVQRSNPDLKSIAKSPTS